MHGKSKYKSQRNDHDPSAPPKQCADQYVDSCQVETILCNTGKLQGYRSARQPEIINIGHGLVTYTLYINNNTNYVLHLNYGRITGPRRDIEYTTNTVYFGNNGQVITDPTTGFQNTGNTINAFDIPACSSAVVTINLWSAFFAFIPEDAGAIPPLDIPIIQVELLGVLGDSCANYNQQTKFSRMVSNGKCL